MLDLIGDVLEFFLVEWFDWMHKKHKIAWVLLEVGVLVLVGGCAVLCLLGGAVVQGGAAGSGEPGLADPLSVCAAAHPHRPAHPKRGTAGIKAAAFPDNAETDRRITHRSVFSGRFFSPG